MSTFTPKPGRPKGSGIDDSRELAEIAALLSTGAETTVEGAIRRVAGDHPSVLRRLHGKFSKQREQLLAAHDAAAKGLWHKEKAKREVAFSATLLLSGGLIVAIIGGLLAAGGSMALFLLGTLLAAPLAAGIALGYMRLFPPLPPRPPGDAPAKRPPPAWRFTLRGRAVALNVGDLMSALLILVMAGFSAWGWSKSALITLLGGAMTLAVALSWVATTLLERGRRAGDARRAVVYGTASGVFLVLSTLSLPLAGLSVDALRLDAHRRVQTAQPLVRALDEVIARLPEDLRADARRTVLVPAYEAALGLRPHEGDAPLADWAAAAAAVLTGRGDATITRSLSDMSVMLRGRPGAAGQRQAADRDADQGFLR